MMITLSVYHLLLSGIIVIQALPSVFPHGRRKERGIAHLWRYLPPPIAHFNKKHFFWELTLTGWMNLQNILTF
jgi:hypothetical protein